MIARAQLALGETRSTAAQLQNQLWQMYIAEIADELCELTECLYLAVTHDITSGANEYALPAVPFKIKAFSCMDASGRWWPTTSTDSTAMDNKIWNWRNNTSTWHGTPQFVIQEGLNAFKVWPIPNYDQPNGFSIEGYYQLSPFWTDMTTECPLTADFQRAIVSGIILKRCEEMSQIDPSYMAKYKMFMPRWKEDRDRCWVHTQQYSDNERQGGPSGNFHQLGAYCGVWGLW